MRKPSKTPAQGRPQRQAKTDAMPELTPDKRSSINWFPGHMVKAMKKIKENVRQVDIVLEIRDARSPLVTGNEVLTEQIKDKSRLIVLNKLNLADPKVVAQWAPWFEAQQTPFIFVNGLEKKSLNDVLELAKKIVHTKHQALNPDSAPKTKLRMMIIGLPNTGKSTIINRFSNRDATKVADKPGQTQNHIWVNVSKDFELLDTPGVMPPSIKNREQGMWLSVLHAIPEKIVDAEDTACFIIEHLLKSNPNAIRDHYKFEANPTDLQSTLVEIAQKRGCILKKNEFDFERVFKLVINDCRDGKFGPISFGLPPKL